MLNNKSRNIGSMAAITPAVKFLLIINISLFVLEKFFRVPITEWFALPADWWRTFDVGQLFTYMFVHSTAGFSHIMMNMLGLFFIGPALERTLGSYRFFTLYYLSGILGGLGWSLLASPGQYCVGASGALMGILGAFAVFYPNEKVALIFLPMFPFKAWKFILAIVLLEFFQTFVHPIFGGIANAAHLVGGIAGFGYAMSIKHPHFIKELKAKRSGFGKVKTSARPGSNPDALSKEDIDRILDKIGKEGMGALTPRERDMLKRATR
jgi:membrane associated rhomboid family serine protease